MLKEKKSNFSCEIKSSTCTIYKDTEIELPAENWNMPKEFQDRLIRVTVSNIISVIFGSIQQKAN